MAKVLTGVNGFVGSHLAERFIKSVKGFGLYLNGGFFNIRFVKERINLSCYDPLDTGRVADTVNTARSDIIYTLRRSLFRLFLFSSFLPDR